MRVGRKMNHNKSLIRMTLVSLLSILLVLSFLQASLSMQNRFHSHTTSDLFETSAEVPSLNLYYYTQDDPTLKVVTDVSFLVGDHVIIRSRWDPLLVNHSRLEIIAPAIPASLLQEEMSHIVDIDTRHLGNNATCTIKCTTWLSNGSAYTVTFDEVFIGNFFYPHVNVLAPNGGEVWTDTHSITWEAIDLNENETLLFDVLVSSDSGVTFSILASTLTTTWFEWNCSSFEEGDTYLIEVRVTDGIYFVSDRSDSPFTIGTAVITTTTITTITTTTTTTNTTNLLTDLRFIVFIVILFTSSAVMALIVYYAARKWF